MNGFNFPPPPDEPVPIVPRDIKAKRIVPSPRKAPTVRSGKGSIFGKASIPSVYWAGDDPTPGGDADEYTFYREGTPPPSEKGRQRGLSLYDQERRAARGQERRNRKCCGLRMWVFWLLVCLIILVVLGVGVGVGVGVGLGASKGNQSDESAARTSSATPTPTTGVAAASPTTPLSSPTASSPSAASSVSTTPATSTKTSSSATSSSSPTATSGPNALCPEAANTFYSPVGSDKRFLRVCGVDYSGDNEAIDMSNMLASSMGECMDICSKTAQCTGAGWGNVTTGEGTTELRCWLKRNLQSAHSAKEGWNFAILQ